MSVRDAFHNAVRIALERDGCVVHLDIKDDKIWVQHNGTEFDISIRLAEMGIGKQNIVNGFHSSYMRQFTEFAVG